MSPFTFALILKSVLDEGIYESQAELLQVLNQQSSYRKFTKGNISKMLAAARLTSFDFIWRHIDHPSTIAVDAARRLVIALEKDSEGVVSNRVSQKLRRIIGVADRQSMTDGQVIQALLQAALSLEAARSVVHDVSVGNVSMKGILRSGKYVITAQGSVSNLNEEDLKVAIDDLCEKLRQ